jgi:hypothetical protein
METYPAFRSSTLRIVPSAEPLGADSESRAHNIYPVDAATLYAPPYDSALADGFAWNLVKYLAPAFDLSVNEGGGGTVVTLTAPATRPGRPPRHVSFAFAYPESDTEGSGTAESDTDGEDQRAFLENVTEFVPPGVLYVLRPEDIVHRLPDVLALVAQWDPALFSERGAVNLERLSSNEARSRRVTPTCTQALLSYPDERSASCLLLDAGIPVPETLVVQRTMRPRSSPPASASAASRAPEDSPSGPHTTSNPPYRRYARSA